MSQEYVQGIVVNKNRILISIKKLEGGIKRRFVGEEITHYSNSEEVISKRISELFKKDIRPSFKLSREFFSNVTTYVFDLQNEDLTTENIKEDMEWVSMENIHVMDRGIINYFNLIYEDCIVNKYNITWKDDIREVMLSSKDNKYRVRSILKMEQREEIKRLDAAVNINEKLRYIVVAIIAGIMFNIFFIDKSFGVSYFVYYIYIVLTFFYFNKERIVIKNRIGLFFTFSSILLALTFAIYSNEVLGAINFITIPIVLTGSFIALLNNRLNWVNFKFLRGIFSKIFGESISNMKKPFNFLVQQRKMSGKVKIDAKKKNMIKGAVVAVPLVVIVIVLLSSADMVFDYYVSSLFSNLSSITYKEIFARIFIIIIVALYAFGYLWSYKYSFELYKPSSQNKPFLDVTTLTVIILILDFIYLIFSMIQFSYLYNGVNNILPAGLNYAEYARRGFFELVLISIINLSLLLYSLYVSKGEVKILSKIALGVLMLFNFNMLFSAHYKLSMYENYYGFTYLRVFVHYFMLFLAIMFIIAILNIWIKKIHFSKIFIIIALSMYVVLNYVNVDKVILTKNMERYYATGKIDMYYMRTLSYDSIPFLIELTESENREIKVEADEYLDQLKEKTDKKKSILEFNYSKAKARKYFH